MDDDLLEQSKAQSLQERTKLARLVNRALKGRLQGGRASDTDLAHFKGLGRENPLG